jgi:hypothetical protein
VSNASNQIHQNYREQARNHRNLEDEPMRSLISVIAATILIATLGSGVALAQSSGNFSGSYFEAACAINNGGGTAPVTFTGGVCTNQATDGTCEILNTGVKTSSGSGVTLLIQPSGVTGLYTDTKVSNTITTSTAEIGIQVCVTVDDSAQYVEGGDKNGCAIYDERLQQVSQNFLAGVAQVATCTSAGGTATNTCFLDFLQATLSAHSYNFIAQVPNGYHNVRATWSIVNASASAGGTVGACLGPGNVLVTQTKVFNNSGAILSF